MNPDDAAFHAGLGEFVLPYKSVRQSGTPEADLVSFFQSTYDAAAITGDWDRNSLEWDDPSRFRR